MCKQMMKLVQTNDEVSTDQATNTELTCEDQDTVCC